MVERKIPEEVQKFIDKYFNLSIAGKVVVCPYFINPSSTFFRQPVMAGKGSPSELETYANEIVTDSSLTSDEIRKKLLEHGIGIDCSGFVYQVLDFWLTSFGKGELKDYLPKESTLRVRKFLSRKLKPVSSVSADMLTSAPLATQIALKDIKPGDLIRTRGGKHVLLVTKVAFTSENEPQTLTFVNSPSEYARNGVRYGEIRIKNMDLGQSVWDDHDPGEKINYAYKGYRELMSKNGVWRLNLPL